MDQWYLTMYDSIDGHYCVLDIFPREVKYPTLACWSYDREKFLGYAKRWKQMTKEEFFKAHPERVDEVYP